MQVNIYITLRESILDPKGKAARQALHNLGYQSVQKVRIGKYVQLDIDSEDVEEARELASQACQKLLANTVMENFEIQIPETRSDHTQE